jgi:hypothetical protein
MAALEAFQSISSIGFQLKGIVAFLPVGGKIVSQGRPFILYGFLNDVCACVIQSIQIFRAQVFY